jgi:hypothetical protein
VQKPVVPLTYLLACYKISSASLSNYLRVFELDSGLTCQALETGRIQCFLFNVTSLFLISYITVMNFIIPSMIYSYEGQCYMMQKAYVVTQ